MNNLLVIDGDNISVVAFSEFYKTNNIIFKQKIVYGDFSRTEMSRWQKFCVDYNFNTFHCPKTGKKQTTDINMTIDIMNKLYSNKYNHIYIATHDCDFVPIANQWIFNDKNASFIATKNVSLIIKNNFHTIYLQNKTSIKDTKITKSTKDKINITDFILNFIDSHPETTLEDIFQHFNSNDKKTKHKRIIKLLHKLQENNEYIWLYENDDYFQFYIYYYPKLHNILQVIQDKNIKTNKTILKYIKKEYPHFALDISDIYNN